MNINILLTNVPPRYGPLIPTAAATPIVNPRTVCLTVVGKSSAVIVCVIDVNVDAPARAMIVQIEAPARRPDKKLVLYYHIWLKYLELML